MKSYRRLLALILSIFAINIILPATVFAAGSIDLDKDVSLQISYRDADKLLKGAKFSLYQIATVDEFGELTTTDEFSQFHVDIRGENEDAWKSMASTLEGYILRDNITPVDSGRTDGNGMLMFPTGQDKLPQGLYMVVGSRHAQGGRYYDAQSFIVMLPGIDHENNDWVYAVASSPKFDSKPIPQDDSTVSRKVLKVWDDKGFEESRPEKVVIELLRDGNVYEIVTLDESNNWRYTWTNLNSDYRWNVVEQEVDGYVVDISREGITFVVTNTITETPPPTPTESPSEPSGEMPRDVLGEYDENYPFGVLGANMLPQTGQLWWPVPVLIASGLLLIVVGLVRRRGMTDEE